MSFLRRLAKMIEVVQMRAEVTNVAEAWAAEVALLAVGVDLVSLMVRLLHLTTFLLLEGRYLRLHLGKRLMLEGILHLVRDTQALVSAPSSTRLGCQCRLMGLTKPRQVLAIGHACRVATCTRMQTPWSHVCGAKAPTHQRPATNGRLASSKQQHKPKCRKLKSQRQQ